METQIRESSIENPGTAEAELRALIQGIVKITIQALEQYKLRHLLTGEGCLDFDEELTEAEQAVYDQLLANNPSAETSSDLVLLAHQIISANIVSSQRMELVPVTRLMVMLLVGGCLDVVINPDDNFQLSIYGILAGLILISRSFQIDKIKRRIANVKRKIDWDMKTEFSLDMGQLGSEQELLKALAKHEVTYDEYDRFLTALFSETKQIAQKIQGIDGVLLFFALHAVIKYTLNQNDLPIPIPRDQKDQIISEITRRVEHVYGEVKSAHKQLLERIKS